MVGCYAVDVEVSDHGHLRRGIVARPVVPGGPTWHRIYLSADAVSGDAEAVLVAAQMAAATCGICTSAVLVSWPA